MCNWVEEPHHVGCSFIQDLKAVMKLLGEFEPRMAHKSHQSLREARWADHHFQNENET